MPDLWLQELFELDLKINIIVKRESQVFIIAK